MLSSLKALKPANRKNAETTWVEQTERELSNPFNRTLAIPGPYISISRTVPDTKLGQWYRHIHARLGWATIQYGPKHQVTYLPGLNTSHVIARSLILNREPNRELLDNVSWGTLHKILNQHVTSSTDVAKIRQVVTLLYGPQATQLLTLQESASANISASLCHHTVGETLNLAQKSSTQHLTLFRTLLRGIKTNNPHAAAQIEEQTNLNLSCTPTSENSPPEKFTQPTAKVLRESPYWTPCPAQLLHTVTKLPADAKDLLAVQLWDSTRQPLSDTYQTAENALQH